MKKLRLFIALILIFGGGQVFLKNNFTHTQIVILVLELILGAVSLCYEVTHYKTNN
ncbi:hypothetical protein AB3K25_09890 [Leuconostoc sp. MS02]|uniref:Uncharacterized protein n=1 Tax=Leuconostoc aquikimchii TaxID=3236804 RepID=A0ABV3S030_9LACO